MLTKGINSLGKLTQHANLPPAGYALKIAPAPELSADERVGICTVLAQAYYQSKMPQRFLDGLETPDLPQLSAYLATQTGEIVAHAMIKPYSSSIPQDIFERYPPYSLKHVSVAPSHRGKGLGKYIVGAVVQAGLRHFETPVIWSASAEWAAIPVYASLGAVFYRPHLEMLNPQLSPADNLAVLKTLLTHRILKQWRFPGDAGFAWARDTESATFLKENSFDTLSNCLI